MTATLFIDQQKLKYAIALQAQAYQCLLWIGRKLWYKRYFKTAKQLADVSQNPKEWVTCYYKKIPMPCRPQPQEINEFSNLLGAFFQVSFEIIENHEKPGHWFKTFLFGFFIKQPFYLKRRRITKSAKKRANKMMLSELEQMAENLSLNIKEETLNNLMEDNILNEKLAIYTYAKDLLLRFKGTSATPAALVLWRKFAWHQNAMKRNFKLNVEMILEAEYFLIRQLHEVAQKNKI